MNEKKSDQKPADRPKHFFDTITDPHIRGLLKNAERGEKLRRGELTDAQVLYGTGSKVAKG